jgi:hypothetical protein
LLEELKELQEIQVPAGYASVSLEEVQNGGFIADHVVSHSAELSASHGS